MPQSDFEYKFNGKVYRSEALLAKEMYRYPYHFAREIREGDLLTLIEKDDPVKAKRISNLMPLAFPDEVFIFLVSLIMNPHINFRFSGYNFDSYEALGASMLKTGPSFNQTLMQLVTYQLVSKHMSQTGYAEENPEVYDKVLDIEKESYDSRERTYFKLGYFLSGKTTIIFNRVEYKDLFTLCHQLIRSEKDLDFLGLYLSTSPLLEAYRDYSPEKETIDKYLHLVKAVTNDEKKLDDFLIGKGEKPE